MWRRRVYKGGLKPAVIDVLAWQVEPSASRTRRGRGALEQGAERHCAMELCCDKTFKLTGAPSRLRDLADLPAVHFLVIVS